MQEDQKDILIIGTGALATLFAARFSKAGIQVTMLGQWEEALKTLKATGATLIEADGTKYSYPVQITARPKNTKLALVLVKSWQTERAARQLTECLAPNGITVTLQNGLGNNEVLAKHLGAERVVQGVTTSGAALVAPGLVRVAGEGLVSLKTHPRLEAFTALLTESGFQSKVVLDAASLIWSKLVINASINPLTALLNIPNGELLLRPSARELMGKLALETASVAAAQNIHLSFEDPVQAVEAVALKTSENISSMLQDIRRGAPSEIDAICGAIMRAGKALNVATPLNDVMVSLIKARTKK